ncbi:unnamed protein product, partial [Symbiodinium microadriaticum]
EWSPHTVEIQGQDGEVVSLRPSGERCLKRVDTARMAMPSLEEALVHAEVNVPTLRASLDDATAPSIPSPVKMQFSPPKQRPPDLQQARAAPP